MELNRVNSPRDIKNFTVEELNNLASEIRELLIKKISINGGHLGPNLGIIEATIALHYVFDSPIDKMIFDVSHQTYTHKILTGRKNAFIYEENYKDVTGFSNIFESNHDHFTMGHTSTSISLACGMQLARDLKKEKYNVISIIGDGSLSGGEAFEGLNVASSLKSNHIIIVNDNQMSIAPNYGGYYDNLCELRLSKGKCFNNMFTSLGLDYIYLEDGNDIEKLIEVFSKVKDIDKPIVVHINTLKGKGCALAIENKEKFHSTIPFDLSTGIQKTSNKQDYRIITRDYLLDRSTKDDKLIILNTATPHVICASSDIRAKFGPKFLDLGICEPTAMSMASSLAKSNMNVVYPIFSSFIDRTIDQISHDLCLNNNPAVILMFWASIYCMASSTHLGMFDVSHLKNIPNLIYLAPTSKEEYLDMLDKSINYKEHPVFIRVPMTVVSDNSYQNDFNFDFKYKVQNKGKDICFILLGEFYRLKDDFIKFFKEKGIDVTIINPRYVNIIDSDTLNDIAKTHEVVVTIEDGVLEGGFNSYISSFYATSKTIVLSYGYKKEFFDKFKADEIIKQSRISPEMIYEDILNAKNNN